MPAGLCRVLRFSVSFYEAIIVVFAAWIAVISVFILVFGDVSDRLEASGSS
jgi:hypothetical protein